jgi:hypothetical protein
MRVVPMAVTPCDAGTSGTRFSPGLARITLPLINASLATFTFRETNSVSNGTHRIAIHVWNMTSMKWQEKNATSVVAGSAVVETASFSAYVAMLVPVERRVPTVSADAALYSMQFIVVRI